MANDFSTALRAEIAQLEASLEADVRFRRLRELRRVLDLYPAPQKSQGLFVESSPEALAHWVSNRVVSSRRASPERAKALDVAKLFLANRVGPTPTREIYEHLVSLGINIPGEVPVNNLSAMLSNSGEFFSNGRTGWTLRGEDSPIPDEVFRTVSEIILADLESEAVREIFAGMARHEGIPPDIDGRLLASVRADIRRDLQESEKRELRSVFREMVESSLSDSDRASISGAGDDE